MASLLTICSLSHSERRALPTKIYDDRARSPTPLRANIPNGPSPAARHRSPVVLLLICIATVARPSIHASVYAFVPTLPREVPPLGLNIPLRHAMEAHDTIRNTTCEYPTGARLLLLTSFLDAPLYRSFLLKPIVFQETKANTPNALEPVRYPIDFPHSRGRTHHHQINLSDSEVGSLFLCSYPTFNPPFLRPHALLQSRKAPIVSSAPLVPVLQYETTWRCRSRPAVRRTHAPHSPLVYHTVATRCNPPGLVLAV